VTTYINLFGPPGVGKSTIAAGLFHYMKRKGYSVELVTEFAKDLVWEDRASTLQIQPYVSMKQFRNLARLRGKVEYVITDSPLIKDSVYARRYATELPNSYHELLFFLHSYLGTSINILLRRKYTYNTEGRLQDERTAIEIGNELKYLLEQNNIAYYATDPVLDDVIEAVYQG